MPGLWETLFGTGDKMSQVSTKTGGQQDLANQIMQSLQGGNGIFGNNQLYQGGSNYLNDLYSQSPDAFNRMSEPYMRQFQQQTVPALAERFSSMGEGGRHTSAFGHALGNAGSNLSSSLAGMFEQMRSQNLGNVMNFANMPYQQAQGALGQNMFENTFQPGNGGLLGNAGTGAAQGFAGAGGMQGMMGLMQMLSSMFGKGGQNPGAQPPAPTR